MILKASQRGGAKRLALHLLNEENEHVTVHELKGFVSDDVVSAFQEIQAISKATKCRKFLFSLSLNPPEAQTASVEDFENAITRIEQDLNLTGQPRCIVFHEKHGRRHAHCVWSRIDGSAMKAIKLPYFKQKLNGIAKELYIEHGWDLPKGFISPVLRDPLNFTLAEWQQAKRHNLDAKEIKHTLQQCWHASDNRQSFISALSEHGFYLAQGDRRGFVALDWRGEIYSLSRSLSEKRQAITAKLGDHVDLPTVAQTQATIGSNYTELHQRFAQELQLKHEFAVQPLIEQRTSMLQAHRNERSALKQQHQQRAEQEQIERQSKIRRGVMGLWDFITGKSRKQHKQNQAEAQAAVKRDRAEKEQLIQTQLTHRRQLQQQLKTLRAEQAQEQSKLSEDLIKDMSPDIAAKLQQIDNKPTLGL